MWGLWLLSFFFVFSVEVKLKASAQTPPRIVSCQDSWLERNKLLDGCHWIQNFDEIQIQTVYGEVLGQNADFFIHQKDNKILVVNHLGQLKVHLKDGRTVEVPMGFEFWFSEVGKNRKNRMGMIQPVAMGPHVEVLSSLWKGSATDLQALLKAFKVRWGPREEMASQYYKRLVQRQIASVEAKKAEKLRQRRKELERREANRKLLFERVFGR